MIEPLHALCHDLAYAFGHESVGNVFKYPLGGEEMYCDPGRFPFMAVAFAVYAKSEMAKRSYIVRVTHEDVSVHYEHPSNGKWAPKANASLDGTDPLSIAHAIIKACVDALNA